MTSEIRAADEAAMDEVAKLVYSHLPQFPVVVLQGDLGAGKTTVVKALARIAGSPDTVSSPTFGLVNEYLDGAGKSIYHFDLYRLKSPEELYGIGFTEYLDSGFPCLIEWPEMAETLLPEHFQEVFIQHEKEGGRMIRHSLF